MNAPEWYLPNEFRPAIFLLWLSHIRRCYGQIARQGPTMGHRSDNVWCSKMNAIGKKRGTILSEHNTFEQE
jgi:hypothetical protein